MLHRGLKKFGSRGNDASSKELIKQVHDRNCGAPRHIVEITPSERRKDMDALMLITEKRAGTIMIYNGKGTHEWVSKDDADCPIAYVESIMVTGVIDSKEDRDVMTGDVPNAFIQASMLKVKQCEERVMM